MKKFKFNLETVLQVRNIAVDKEKAELSKVVGFINKLQNAITENNQSINSVVGEVEYIKMTGQDLRVFRVYDRYVKTLFIKNDSLNLEINNKQIDLNAARLKLTEAKKNAEVLEILKRKRENEFHKTFLKKKRKEEEERNYALYLRKKEAMQDELETSYITDIETEEERTENKKSASQTDLDKLIEYSKSQFSNK